MVWPSDPDRLAHDQLRVAALEPEPWRFRPGAMVGACFVCFSVEHEDPRTTRERAWAAAVTFSGARRMAATVVEGSTDAPYLPGLLALRAGSLLERAVTTLRVAPAALLVNATGRDHPRAAGLALHLGAYLDVPTVGVTDRPLLADGPEPTDDAGASAPLRRDGEVVALRVRTRAGARWLVVHPAWRTDAVTALYVVMASAGAARTPLPLREARRLARTARAAAAGKAPYPADLPRPL